MTNDVSMCGVQAVLFISMELLLKIQNVYSKSENSSYSKSSMFSHHLSSIMILIFHSSFFLYCSFSLSVVVSTMTCLSIVSLVTSIFSATKELRNRHAKYTLPMSMEMIEGVKILSKYVEVIRLRIEEMID